MSVKVKSILDEIKNEYDNFSINDKKVNLDNDVNLNEYQVKSIISVIKHFIDTVNINFAKKFFIDIFKNPNIKENGKIYETLLYGWLIEHKIGFEPQPKILSKDCFKEKDYLADGKISNVVFDVKSFGIGFPHIDTFKNKLQNEFKNYIITISGSKNMSDKDLEKYLFNNFDNIVCELHDDKNKIHNDYIYTIKELNLKIRANSKERGFATSISEFNSYEWAQENQFFFLKHASQFCKNSPYMIFCPFDSAINSTFSQNKESINTMLRALCRRIFMNLKNMNDKKLYEYDGKSIKDVTVSTASKKLSAIIFLDVTKKHTYEDCRTWVYTNPNADNKLYIHQINTWFRFNGAFIDDFQYDNY